MLLTHFFSLETFEFGDASPRAALCSDRPSELPASASYEARPRSFRGIDFCVFVRWMMCYEKLRLSMCLLDPRSAISRAYLGQRIDGTRFCPGFLQCLRSRVPRQWTTNGLGMTSIALAILLAIAGARRDVRSGRNYGCQSAQALGSGIIIIRIWQFTQWSLSEGNCKNSQTKSKFETYQRGKSRLSAARVAHHQYSRGSSVALRQSRRPP